MILWNYGSNTTNATIFCTWTVNWYMHSTSIKNLKNYVYEFAILICRRGNGCNNILICNKNTVIIKTFFELSIHQLSIINDLKLMLKYIWENEDFVWLLLNTNSRWVKQKNQNRLNTFEIHNSKIILNNMIIVLSFVFHKIQYIFKYIKKKKIHPFVYTFYVKWVFQLFSPLLVLDFLCTKLWLRTKKILLNL